MSKKDLKTQLQLVDGKFLPYKEAKKILRKKHKRDKFTLKTKL